MFFDQNMKVRKFRTEDAKRCSIIIRKCVREQFRKEEKPKTIQILIKRNKPSDIIRRSKNEHFYVAVEKEKILGIGGYDDDGYLHKFFVDMKHQSKGIGKLIVARVFKDAKRQGLNMLQANASPGAEKFYKSAGFRKIKKMTVPWKGSTITFVKMKKKLE